MKNFRLKFTDGVDCYTQPTSYTDFFEAFVAFGGAVSRGEVGMKPNKAYRPARTIDPQEGEYRLYCEVSESPDFEGENQVYEIGDAFGNLLQKFWIIFHDLRKLPKADTLIVSVRDTLFRLIGMGCDKISSEDFQERIDAACAEYAEAGVEPISGKALEDNNWASPFPYIVYAIKNGLNFVALAPYLAHLFSIHSINKGWESENEGRVGWLKREILSSLDCHDTLYRGTEDTPYRGLCLSKDHFVNQPANSM